MCSGGSHDGYFLVDRLCCHSRKCFWPHDASSHGSVDADDVCFTCRVGQHSFAATADEQWGTFLNGLWLAVVIGDVVMVAGERKWAVCHCATNHSNAFNESVDANFRRVVRNACFFVIANHPAGAKSNFDTTV